MTTEGVDPSDLARLTEGGPFLSVYVPSREEWTTVRPEMAELGAPESALDLVDSVVSNDDISSEETLAVIANADEVLMSEHLPEALIYGRASWAPIADLVPILKARQAQHPSVAVPDDDPVAVATAVAEDTVDVLEQFKRDRGNADLVADGIDQTTKAMADRSVEVLLVRDDRDERHDVARGDAALVDELIRDAIVAGATVRVVPANGPVTEGVGALLRK
jgi:hypothetical protein